MEFLNLVLSPALFGNRWMGWTFTALCVAAGVYLVIFLLLPKEKNFGGDVQDEGSTILIAQQHGAVSDALLGLSSVLGTRPYQQDRVGGCGFVSDKGNAVFAVLCDGMGGMAQGDRASEHCKSRFVKEFLDTPHDWEKIPGELVRISKQMDKEVAAFEDDSGQPLKSGTTMVAACLRGTELFWISIGDSRIYVYENKKLRQITRDHSYSLKLDKMVAQGKMSRERADAEPRKDALISYIGMGNTTLIDGNKTAMVLKSDSIVLLCSDGVTKLLSDSQIENIFEVMEDHSAAAIAEEITSAATASRKRSQDNTSAIVIKVKAEK